MPEYLPLDGPIKKRQNQRIRPHSDFERFGHTKAVSCQLRNDGTVTVAQLKSGSCTTPVKPILQGTGKNLVLLGKTIVAGGGGRLLNLHHG